MAQVKRKAALAIQVERADRPCVVTAARARWKEKHTTPTQKMIRFVRFVWMRNFTQEDRHKLNGHLLGAALRARWVWYDDLEIAAIDPKHMKGY